MALTRDFKQTIQARATKDPDFRQALLTESIQCMLKGEFETGKSILRDYINSTIGFQELSRQVGKQPQSLMRMLSTTGNPEARNLFHILNVLQDHEGIDVTVSPMER